MITLRRFACTPFGMFGELSAGSRNFYTVERPWMGNAPFVSCVPLGLYKMLWRPTTTPVPDEYAGHTWYLEGGSVGVNDDRHRQNCAFHIGNTAGDVQGCIAVGCSLGTVGTSWGVVSSRLAMSMLVNELGPRANELTITGTLLG